jgi:flagellar M-ring protein FliF
MDLMRNGLLGLGFIALLLLVVRPMLKMLAPPPEPVSMHSMEPIALGMEQQGQLPGPAEPHVARLGLKSVSQLELLETVMQEPYMAAQILQTWLRQPE